MGGNQWRQMKWALSAEGVSQRSKRGERRTVSRPGKYAISTPSLSMQMETTEEQDLNFTVLWNGNHFLFPPLYLCLMILGRKGIQRDMYISMKEENTFLSGGIKTQFV